MDAGEIQLLPILIMVLFASVMLLALWAISKARRR
jgi:hypothetical protein